MGIFKHPKTGIYHANYFDAFGKRCRPSLGTKDKRIAEVKFADLRKKKGAIKDMKFAQAILLEDFEIRFSQFIAAEKAPNTILRYNNAFKYLKEYSPSLKLLTDITPELLQKFKEELLHQGKGIAGINRTIMAIKAAMHQAENWDYIPPQKWNTVKKFKEKKGRIDFYTPEEVHKILDEMGLEWRLVVLLGARAGLRRGEMANLRWRDIDLKNNQMYIAANKTENFRYVPIHKELLAELKSAWNNKEEFVIKEFGECPRSSGYFISAAYKKKLKSRKIRGSLHTLRHTFASHLVQNGVDLYTVSKLLGHTSIKTTEIYAHLAPKTLHFAIEKLK